MSLWVHLKVWGGFQISSDSPSVLAAAAPCDNQEQNKLYTDVQSRSALCQLGRHKFCFCCWSPHWLSSAVTSPRIKSLWLRGLLPTGIEPRVPTSVFLLFSFWKRVKVTSKLVWTDYNLRICCTDHNNPCSYLGHIESARLWPHLYAWCLKCAWIFENHHHTHLSILSVNSKNGPKDPRRSRFTSRSLWMHSCSSGRSAGPPWVLPSDFRAAVLPMLCWDQRGVLLV